MQTLLRQQVPIAKTATEVAAAMAGLGDDVLGDDVKGVSKSVGDADQQLAEEQVSAAQEAPEPAEPTETTDATMDLLKQQLDEDTRSRLGTEEESGVRSFKSYSGCRKN